MPLLVIGNKNYSSWSLRPWLLLRAFDVPFDEHRLVLDTPAFHDEIARWSPTRCVPVLHDEGLVVSDSLAICEYANERWLEGAGWPASRAERAVARSAAAEMHAGFGNLRARLPMNVRRTPDAYRWDEAAQRDIDRVQQLWRRLRATHGDGGPFLFGDFGIADAMFAPVAFRFLGYGVTMEAVANAYVDALLALPAMQEWRAAAHAEPETNAGTDALVHR